MTRHPGLPPVVLTDLDLDRDASALHFALADPQVSMPWLGWPPSRSVTETRARLAERAARGDVHDWCVRESSDGPALGLIERIGTGANPGIGWMMRRDHWGRGLTTAAIETVVAHLFADGALSVEAWVDVTNDRSIRVAHRAGFTVRGRFAVRDDAGHLRQKLVLGRVHDGDTSSVLSVDPVLAVHDVEATVELLTGGLGFVLGFAIGGDVEPMRYAHVRVGPWTNVNGLRLRHTIGPPTPVSVAIEAGVPLGALHQRAVAAGAHIESGPVQLAWGAYQFVVVLPEGHRLEVTGPVA